jgi:hypothetical protein
MQRQEVFLAKWWQLRKRVSMLPLVTAVFGHDLTCFQIACENPSVRVEKIEQSERIVEYDDLSSSLHG